MSQKSLYRVWRQRERQLHSLQIPIQETVSVYNHTWADRRKKQAWPSPLMRLCDQYNDGGIKPKTCVWLHISIFPDMQIHRCGRPKGGVTLTLFPSMSTISVVFLLVPSFVFVTNSDETHPSFDSRQFLVKLRSIVPIQHFYNKKIIWCQIKWCYSRNLIKYLISWCTYNCIYVFLFQDSSE